MYLPLHSPRPGLLNRSRTPLSRLRRLSLHLHTNLLYRYSLDSSTLPLEYRLSSVCPWLIHASLGEVRDAVCQQENRPKKMHLDFRDAIEAKRKSSIMENVQLKDRVYRDLIETHDDIQVYGLAWKLESRAEIPSGSQTEM